MKINSNSLACAVIGNIVSVFTLSQLNMLAYNTASYAAGIFVAGTIIGYIIIEHIGHWR